MSKVKNWEFKINCSPHLICADITKGLFNRNFHSDIQFCVENKIIYAHSLELMKRSVVFEERLEALLSDNKLIPVVDCKYESFLEFMRFIYTDECEITVENAIDILKLAIKYKVVMLENKLINCMNLNYSKEWLLKLFEFCVINKYELVRNTMNFQVARSFGRCLATKQFLTLHPEAVDALLQFDRVPSDVTEGEVFTALGNWITSYSTAQRIPISEGRELCDKLIRQIRFPAMSNKKINECCKQFPGLLSKIDCLSIAEQTIFGGSDAENCLWASKRRAEFKWPYEYGTFNRDNRYETRVSVSNDIILYGIRIGANPMICEKTIEVEISTNDLDKFTFQLGGLMFWDLTINLGDSLRLKSNCEYKIMIKYLDNHNVNIQVLRRKEGCQPIINDETKSVRILQISRNVFEMFFKAPADAKRPIEN